MTEISEQIARLSPEKQQLLVRLLRERGVPGHQLPILPRQSRGEPSPASFAQERLWFLHQLDRVSSAYNVAVVLRIAGHLNVDILHESFTEVVRRHESLRSVFLDDNGRALQLVLPQNHLSWNMEDLADLPGPDREKARRHITAQTSGHPFDLVTGPLIRVSVIRMAEDEHILVLALHHITADGWSMGLLVQEIAKIYEALSSGLRSPLPELKVQYADYAIWQREALQGELLKQQLDYWRQQLEGEPPLLELPFDHVRSSHTSEETDSVVFRFSPELTSAAKKVAGRAGMTPFMLLMAAYQLMLSRYTGETDIWTGTPVANRNRAELEPLIGFFVNTLVVRTDLSDDSRVCDLLTRVRETAIAAFAHQDLPFELLVRELHPSRDLSHAPLFQTMFALQNAPVPPLQVAGLRIEAIPAPLGAPMFDLVMLINESEGQLAGTLEYNAGLFEQASVRRMCAHFENIVKAFVADQSQRLSCVGMLADAEWDEIVSEWNRTEASFPSGLCLHEVFEAQAQRTPDTVAITFGEQQLTYQELDFKSNQLAHTLRRFGVGPDVLAAVCVERSIELIVSILGVMKAGGAYLPLDPRLPSARLSYMITDSRPTVLITEKRLESVLPSADVPVVYIDQKSEWMSAESGVRLETGVVPDNLAYVIYTSGSTGQPKGTMLAHRGLVNLTMVQRDAFAAMPGKRFLQFASMSFDASIWEISMALANGATLCLAPQLEVAAVDRLSHILRETEINTVFLPPSVLALLPNEDLPNLETVITGGEACTEHVVDRWGSRRLFNAYGPTEITVCCSITRCDPECGRSPSIGSIAGNYRFYVLDRDLLPVPIGVAGELYVGGVGVARGYLGRPALTAEKFVPDPFSSVSGARLYRTGDRVRWRGKGELEFLGRVDNQVKLRGYRIELGEIEAALRQDARVKDCVVTIREDTPGMQRLVAYFVACDDAIPTALELREKLKGFMPEYMVPTVFMRLGALPLTINGKVDRHALPVPTTCEAAKDKVAPGTIEEQLLASIWGQLLGKRDVSVRENFFEAGGHSLLATQLVSRIREAFGIDIPVRAVFEHPDLASMAEAIRTQRIGAIVAAPPITRARREGPVALSHAQQRLWFLDKLAPNSAAYNIPAVLRFTGTLNIPALRESFEELVRRHEALRTVFVEQDGRPAQVVLSELELPFQVRDVAGLPVEQREREALKFAGADACRPFDLTRGPLFRVLLVRLADEQHLLSLTMHHIISDGWSIGVLVRETSALYEKTCGNESARVPELPIQYPDYALWQRDWLTGDVLESQLTYWRERLEGMPAVLDLPTDRPRPAAPTYRGGYESFEVPQQTSAALTDFAERKGATPFMVLLTAFMSLLSRYTRQTDICVGTPIANRTHAELEPLIGLFVNTLVLRADLSDDPQFATLLHRVREASLGAYAHQDLPFDLLVDNLHAQRDLSRSSLFQVSFVFQNTAAQQIRLPGLMVEHVPIETGTAKFDLSLSMGQQNGTFSGTFEYNADMFDPATIQRMVEHFQTLLQAAIADPARCISELPVLSPAERERLLRIGTETATESNIERCLHQLFEQQAFNTPDALAVYYEGASLTYEQLNRRANFLAHHLRGLGVGPDVLVGLGVERSVELIVGLLAIWKAGGAYVPLAPAYPRERLAFMLRDSRARFLLTTRSLAPRFGDGPSELVPIEEFPGEAAEAPPNATVPDNLAYVIYTSGSTGTPKAVMVPHRSVLNLKEGLEAAIYKNHPFRSMRVSLNAPLSFDASVQQIVMLLNGHALFVIPEECRRDGEAMAAYIRRNRLDVLDCVPSQLKMMIPVGLLDGGHIPEIVLPGGEPIDDATWLRIVSVETADFYNMYGPTECTVDCIVCRCKRSPDRAVIGRPLANARAYILDAHFEPVPIGVVGELYIGGEGVARGYLGQPCLTAERFVPDPFVQEGARLYRTGDLARFHANGLIEYLGRVDEQVKIRGHRIEPGEIESVLKRHEAVKDAAVVARVGIEDKRLAAYIVARTSERPLNTELRRWLKERLPEYMVPASFTWLDHLPLTPNAKVDRGALPEPVMEAENDGGYMAPRNGSERVLADIWQQVLGVRQVGIHDNFFELGGDSILSIQVVARARQAGLELTAKQLFQAPTVAGLAATAGKRPTTVIAEQGVVEGRVDLSPIQRWWAAEHFAEPWHWNQSVMLQTEPLDREALQAALAALLRQHDALRLRLRAVDGSYEAWNAGLQDEPALEWFDLQAEDARGQKAAMERESARLQASLDLEHGPLVRAGYFGLGPSGRLLIVIHHLVVDGVSWHILFEDLERAYERAHSGNPIALGPKTTSWRQWSQRLTTYAESSGVRDQFDYWDELSARTSHSIPVDFPGGDTTEANTDVVRVALSAEETHLLLHQLPSVHHLEVGDVLLACFGDVLCRWTKNERVLIDLERHGREEIADDIDISRTVGWFTTIHPFEVRLRRGSFEEHIGRTRDAMRRLPNRGFDYLLLTTTSGEERVRSWKRPQVIFNHLGQFEEHPQQGRLFAFADESRGPERSAKTHRSWLIGVNSVAIGAQLHIMLDYSRTLHRRSTIEVLAQSYLSAIRSALVKLRITKGASGKQKIDLSFPLANVETGQLRKLVGKMGQ